MKALPTNGAPFNVQQQIQAQLYGHQQVYANSENITPPIEKDRRRVVEAASRTEVKLAWQKAIEDRMQEIADLRRQAALRYNRDLSTVSELEVQGQIIDIEV